MKTELLAWLINATLATSLAGIAIVLLRKPLQRWLGAEIAYRLWIVLPLATLAACFSLPQPAPVAMSSGPVTLVAVPATMVRMANDLGRVNADRWLLSIWLLGAGALLLMLMRQQRRYVARLRLRRGSDGSWRSAKPDAAPAVLGVLRQKLVLPEGFESEYSDAEQQLVIAHERMHQQRRDPWALAVCAALRTLFWFNPIMHFAAIRFRRDIEMACDAAVLRAHPGSRQRYANALLKIQLADHAVPVGCLWHYTPPMKERIMLLKQNLPTRHKKLAGAIVVVLASFGITGFALSGHDSALSTAGALAASPQAAEPDRLHADLTSHGRHVAAPVVIAMNARSDATWYPVDAMLTSATAPPAPPAAPEPPTAPTPPTPPTPPAKVHHSLASAHAPLPPLPPTAPTEALAPLPAMPPSPARALAPLPPLPPVPSPAAFAPTPPAPPAYPKTALKGNLGGEVHLRLSIGADGLVKHAVVESSRPAGVFDQASLDAAKNWHFTPGRNARGQPIATEVRVPVIFEK